MKRKKVQSVKALLDCWKYQYIIVFGRASSCSCVLLIAIAPISSNNLPKWRIYFNGVEREMRCKFVSGWMTLNMTWIKGMWQSVFLFWPEPLLCCVYSTKTLQSSPCIFVRFLIFKLNKLKFWETTENILISSVDIFSVVFHQISERCLF